MKLILTLATLLLASAAVFAKPENVDVAADNDVVLPQDNDNDVATMVDEASNFKADVVSNDAVDAQIGCCRRRMETCQSPDLKQLVNELINLHDSASIIIERVESTLLLLEPLVPHSVKRRETTVDGSVERGEDGHPRGRVGVTHRRGNTVYNGSISRDRHGTSVEAGASHTSRDGRTRVSGSVSRGSRGRGTSGRITFSHRF